LAKELQEFFEKNSWEFCFIGGLALQRWGQPRLTLDVDISLLTGFGEELSFVEPLLLAYRPRIDDAKEFALENRVLLLKSERGIGIDIVFAGLPFEEEMINRASFFEFLPAIHLRTCSADDLVVMKAFAGRTQDWADIEGILLRQRGAVDERSVMKTLRPLAEAKGEPEILDRLKGLFERLHDV
jgi:hypothetical protein